MSLLKLLAYGVQGDFLLSKRSDYEIFTNGCYMVILKQLKDMQA